MTRPENSTALMGESMAMLERAVGEVCGIEIKEGVDLSRFHGTTDAQRVDTIYLDGKPILQMWPPEVTFETRSDVVVTTLTRKWRKL